MKHSLSSLLFISGLLACGASQAAGRSQIDIVGSSTVYPFATVVAERFGKASGLKTPKIESTGTGGGMKLFCKGVGIDTPDVSNASRRIKRSEYDRCQNNGVSDIIEVLIGYDGIVLANSKKAQRMALSRRDIFLALAKNIPATDGSKTLVSNPHKTWKSVNATLPDIKIEVLGPPPTSGTRDAFAELAMEGGCKTFTWIKAIKKTNKAKYKAVCHTMREDGAYIEAGENDNLIVQKLAENPQAFGVFGFSFLDQNTDTLQGSIIDNKQPEFEAIAAGDYPVSRPLFFYVKKAHIGTVPGIVEYMKTFTSEAAFGPDGYLSEKGLIPLPENKRRDVVKMVSQQQRLSL